MSNRYDSQISPTAKRWYLANPWFGNDDFLTSRALDIHLELIEDKKIKFDSQRYFDEIDRRIYNLFKERLEKFFSMDN